jgi:stearoyl-CoA desaturase (Delta-9 desaturase)
MQTNSAVDDRSGLRERQLAWFTVGIPTLGTILAVVLALYNGIGVLELLVIPALYRLLMRA